MNKTTIYDFGFAVANSKERLYASTNAARKRWQQSMHRFRQAQETRETPEPSLWISEEPKLRS